MIYISREKIKVGQTQEIKGFNGFDKLGNIKYFFGHGVWLEVENKIEYNIIKDIIEKYCVFDNNHPTNKLKLQKTIINIYLHKDELDEIN